MKLVIPPLAIDESTPFSNDVLGRDTFGEALLNLIIRTEDNLVIALDASWGEGKTTFVKMWRVLLKEHGIQSIYFDAFVNDYLNEPFMALASEITTFIKEELPKDHPARKKLGEFKKKAAKAGVQLLSWGAKIGIKAATLGVIGDIEELKDIAKDLAQSPSEVISNYIEEKLSTFQEDRATIQSFREKLQELASDIKQESKFPLVIIIDELDRCKPTYALDLIEKIKHVFSVENTVFLLALHKQQLEEVVQSEYGQNIDATTYLQKFINVECKLPKNTKNISFGDYSKYCQFLTKQHELTHLEREDRFEEVMVYLADYFNLSLRDLERCYTNLTIFYASIPERSLRLALIIDFLAILKVKFPELYRKVKAKRIGVEELVTELKLSEVVSNDNAKKHILHQLVIMLRFFLLPEEQFNALDENHEVRAMAGSFAQYAIDDRNRIISNICENMDLFTLPQI